MFNNFWFFLLIVFTGMLLPSVASTQTTSERIATLQQQYRNLHFEAVIQEGRELLKQAKGLNPQQLATIHEQMALSFFSLGQLDSSRSHFLSLLSLFPEWQLDPIYVSPKIIDFFQQLKKTYTQQSVMPAPSAVPYTRYIIVEDRRPGAAWRSLLLPGWGQWYKSQKKRAYWVGGTVFLSAAGTLAAALLERNAHQIYLATQDEQLIAQRYDRYNFWFKTRYTMQTITLLGWALNVVDALWTPSPISQRIRLSAAGGQLKLVWQF